jgi:tetratricopeptide (TPR) repeat protein
MKKLLGLALVPVILATVPLMSYGKEAIQKQTNKMNTTVQATKAAPDGWMEMVHVNTFSTPQARTEFLNGQWQLVDKNYPEAIQRFESVLVSDPNSVRTHHGVALAAFYNEENTKALQHVDRAIALDPVNPKLLYTKARILDAMGKDADALENYLLFVSMDPTDSSAIQAQRRADEIFRRWEARFTEDQKHYFSGLRFLSMEQPEKALPLFEKFVVIKPTDLKGHYLLGMTHRNMNQPEKAITHFEKVTNTEPNNSMAYYQLGWIYEQTGKKQNAQNAWTQFVKFAPHAEQVGVVNEHLKK